MYYNNRYLKELSFESGVSLLAGEVSVLTKSAHAVWVEKDAGLKAFCVDEDYRMSGAEIRSGSEILKGADMLLSIHADDLSSLDKKQGSYWRLPAFVSP
ncbi:Rossmann-fold NAD(P)-binding domain-containing protein [Mucilaginibacter ginsenosidivorans]|uniref:Alanine dehydrogenase/pyridine nucleotide transhydrogenase N-terminal domain-containing protein n=1 Tax=Mucilaginibacter ginsenosidivorans TaxID=398053 RepID=A0A5B8V265_9SPHI|nr:hypothetical protein FRZ54_05400 [Mucilaginibacter ginsenosidivorans]